LLLVIYAGVVFALCSLGSGAACW